MCTCKITITLERSTLKKLDLLVREGCLPSRSAVIRAAIGEKIARSSRERLARECAKLDPLEEQRIADLGLVQDLREWPAY
jgi:Arc/MetJ-type ribon-helix-helix transcriptional regulator